MTTSEKTVTVDLTVAEARLIVSLLRQSGFHRRRELSDATANNANDIVAETSRLLKKLETFLGI